MGMNPIRPGLRSFVNDSVSVAKLDLRVPPGAVIAVDDEVAAQLPGNFRDPDAVAERDARRRALAEPAPPADDDGDGDGLEAAADGDCDPLPEPGDADADADAVSDAEPVKPKRNRG